MPLAARREMAGGANDDPPVGGASAPEAALTDDEFAALMASFAPFETAPVVAVAVSGGRDSLCLALLAARWAAQRGGYAVALTVDHGLRAEAAAEARQVATWMAARATPHAVLRWSGPHPASGIQAAARQARYRLLEDYCCDHAILHLLVAHHREDQAETVMIRGAAASGDDGLAAMAAVSERTHVRLLRPLLTVARSRLTATLAAHRQDWLDDPSNENIAMARARLRRHGPVGVVDAAAALAEASGRARVAVERAVAALAARAALPHPAGFVVLDRAALMAAPPEIAERLLARAVMAVAGRIYPPRSARTGRLWAALRASPTMSDRTLGGCRIVRRSGTVYVCREPAQLGPDVRLRADAEVRWDGRFTASTTDGSLAGLRLGALTMEGWRQLVAGDPQLRGHALPHAVRIVLPALWADDRVVAVPHLAIARGEYGAKLAGLRVFWQPAQALVPAAFGKV